MSNKLSRRDWLKLIGGSAVGLMLTPMPWKILDESAKWTQNWSWTPVPPRGRIRYKYTTCTLCPMACGVRIRCVGNKPIGLSGVPGHPVSDGALCAMGLAGHLLKYHPSRLLQPFKKVNENGDTRLIPVSPEMVISDIATAISTNDAGSVAILDMQPNRTISYMYRRFLAGLNNGVYINAPTTGGIPAGLTNSVSHCGNLVFGYDVKNTKTILSFGTPILDGWGTQGQFSTIMKSRGKGLNDRVKIIQVESAHSRTAQLADKWFPVRPGTEAALALSLANILISEKYCDISRLRARSVDFENPAGRSFTDLTRKFNPDYAAEKTGLPADRIRQLAREIASRKPAVAVFGGNPGSGPFALEEQVVFMDLNILLGSLGKEGGLVAPQEIPAPFDGNIGSNDTQRSISETMLADVPDRSIKVLIMDGADSGDAIPWSLIRQKLTSSKSTVVSLASHLTGAARRADYLLPSPGYMEAVGDMPTPSSAAVASYSVIAPITSPPSRSLDAFDFVKRIAATMTAHPDSELRSLTMQDVLRNRVENIYSRREGFVFDAATGKIAKLSELSRSAFQAKLEQGGAWFDDEAARLSPVEFSFLGGTSANFDRIVSVAERTSGELILLPIAARGARTAAEETAMMTKLYRGSGLRTPGKTVSMNPVTGKKRGLTEGTGAVVRTDSGSAEVKVRYDPAIMPDVLEAQVGPLPGSFDRAEAQAQDDILEICKIEDNSTWQTTTAEIFPL